jgi:eukaryotic-like serine/threonine-protein kinase
MKDRGPVAGSALGPYELLAPIGAGGMGQVFRARDTRLGRTVAIKVLPPHRSAVADFAERFEREARAISSLNHPNVCALFDVGKGSVDGTTVAYFVMEHLEGENLRERLHAPMTVRQAIDIAVQVARGLAAAHRNGLVHRDLKPENIFITRDGLVKILDFGVVKATEPGHSGAKTPHMTEPGLVIGTPHYTSPEQVRGDRLDPRSDIFAFGVVLYEMVAAQQPFDGGSPVETMAEILHNDHRPLDDLVADLPPGLSEIVDRCLAKDPEERFASARDLAFSLEAIARGARSPAQGTRKTPSRSTAATRVPPRRSRVILALLLLSALALTIIAGRLLTRDEEDDGGPPPVRPITHSGQDASPAASPDGRLIAFVSSRDGSRRIWIEQLADGTEVALTAGPDDAGPRFSPDGSMILFTRSTATGSALYRVAVVGGEARKAVDNAFDGDFAPDGRRIAFVRDRVAGTQRLSTICIGTPGGADVQELVSSATDDLFFPRWSPDGRWIAVTKRPRSTTAGSLLLVRVEDGAQRVIARREAHGMLTSAAWARDSRSLVFGELEALSVVLLRTRGGGARILRYDLARSTLRSILWNAHAAADTIDLLPDGRLLFSENLTRQNLREVTLGAASEARWLTRGMAVDRQPSFSADGRRIVFCSDRSANVDVWALDLASAAVERLTDDAAVDWDPVLAANGSLLWSSNRGGHFEVWSGGADGSGARQVSRDGKDAENPSMPRDGSWIYYDASGPKEGLWRVRPDGSGAVLIAAGETAHPEVSADGQYVAYHSPDKVVVGTSHVEVLRIADGARFTLAKASRGARPRWLGAAHTIVFINEDAQQRSGLFAQDFVPGSDTSATRRKLAGFDRDTTIETFALSPDGTRAVVSVLEPSSGLMVADLR